MSCRPQVLLDRPRPRAKISLILIDWKVRESFHTLHYLNQQNADRDDYEIIWLEYYDHRPPGLEQLVASHPGVLDRWIVLGHPDDWLVHKHRAYNAGLLAATAPVCVICDSDAIYAPTFIETIIRAFEETPRRVIHLDQVRNNDPRFYPFNYPTIPEILGPGCANWDGTATIGKTMVTDRIHAANYGACQAARREDLLAIGGADEHADYLGYYCGPYELTFRLINHYGIAERWLWHEYLYHAWHPDASGSNTNYHGPNDGRGMSLRALDARASYRVRPYRSNPLLRHAARGPAPRLAEFLDFLRTRDEPEWRATAPRPELSPDVYWVERGYLGFNIFTHAGRWYAVPDHVTRLDPDRARRGGYRCLLQAETRIDLDLQIDARGPRVLGTLGKARRLLLAQPPHRLPLRLWRRSCRLVASARPPRPPWPPSPQAARPANGAGLGAAREIEFGGYLLADGFGNAGSHPQFEHILHPPPGYAFVQKPQSDGPVDAVLQGAQVQELRERARALGAGDRAIERFLATRPIERNACLNPEARVVFVPSVPYCVAPKPWLIEIEDVGSLFFPFLDNGRTRAVDPRACECFPVLKALLESSFCRAIVTHVKSTAESLPKLFQSAVIALKVHHCPIGVRLPLTRPRRSSERFHMVFTNSWHQADQNFYLRGGVQVLEAFLRLSARHPNVYLTIRSSLPALQDRHRALLDHPRVEHLRHFVGAEHLHHLLSSCDLFLIPAARLHVVSVVRALSYGIPVLCTDGWGFDEYVEEGRTGFRVPGMQGVCSWIDEGNGMLREDYAPLLGPEKVREDVVEGIVATVERLLADRDLHAEVGRQARATAEARFSLARWNDRFREVLEQVA